MAISVVINTFNEEENIIRSLKSVYFADEIVIIDMNSTDKTREIAQKLGAKVYLHPKVGFVEPARNFAIEKANSDWILILDADEEIKEPLIEKIQTLTMGNHGKSFFRIPRKNIIFNKWIKHARFWPDLQIRLFKKGKVTWLNEIHSIPVTTGEGVDMEIREENAIIHHNYSSVTQFINRMNRYTSIQAKEKLSDEYQFKVDDILKKPFAEFLSRFLAGQGYKDGLHGLAISLLQAFSELVVQLKLWEKKGFSEEDIDLSTFEKEINQHSSDLHYWLREEKIGRDKNNLRRIVKKVIS